MNTESTTAGTARSNTVHPNRRSNASRGPNNGSRRPSRRTAISPPLRTTATPKAAGVYRPHPRGFGFVDLEAPLSAADGTAVTSCFIPPPLASGLLDGDTVGVTVDLSDGRGTATSATVLRRDRTELFGVLNAAETGLALRVDPHVGHGPWKVIGDAPKVGTAVRCTITPAGMVAKAVTSASAARHLTAREPLTRPAPQQLGQVVVAMLGADPDADMPLADALAAASAAVA